ncbi:holin [Clostridium botulinum]|uniref:holin n=1 Tax=Clostridium botulinum TaxID=1491 RepID=UPI0004D6C465|nr:holin [Clostridium botulinum]KEH99979.1 holin [Clostridium botulinum C/D str. BKT75002]KEI05701.1 holin [Clostridium botulinum C/D str. BKT2873]MCD3351777.1 holin [Clostridium botulinum D/C]MCD3360703.1 holin [Clostridium botulinum D/C]MCD3362129.1 holin [Clostridium botulinum D/C]
MVKNRLKNYGLWSSLFAFIPIFLEGIKVYNINIILPNNYEMIVKALLGLLVLAGILNNPTTDNKGFSDDKTNECKIITNTKEFNDEYLFN